MGPVLRLVHARAVHACATASRCTATCGPIFVSFHCNKRDLLTPDAVEYLRRYGPVGCRDWTTTHLLTSMGVPAFFSGCLTTTIGGVFPDAPAARADAPVAYVDVRRRRSPRTP